MAEYDYKAELEQKAVELLTEVVDKHEKGRMSDDMADGVLSTIWRLTAGFVSREVSLLANEAAASVRGPNECRTVMLDDKGNLALIDYPFDGPNLRLHWKRVGQPLQSVTHECAPDERDPIFQRIKSTFWEHGYKII